jgi:hypothetical protein
VRGAKALFFILQIRTPFRKFDVYDMKKLTIVGKFQELPFILKLTTVLSLVFFGTSLTQPAYDDAAYSTLNYGGSGFGVLIMGWVSLSAGILPFLIWLANPIYFISIYLMIKRKWYTILLISIAVILSVSFYFVGPRIIIGDNPVIPTFLESGYYLSLASFLILLVGYLINKIKQ